MIEDQMNKAKQGDISRPRKNVAKTAGTEYRPEQGRPDERRRFEDLVSV